MNELPRERLRELIARHGRSVCDDPRRCQALLRDYCAGYKREIHLLVNALHERIASDLLSSQGAVTYEVQFARLTKRLRDNLGVTSDAAAWAVESWALALGLTVNSPSEEQRPTEEKIRAVRKRKTAVKNQQPDSPGQKPSARSETRSEQSAVRVIDKRASNAPPEKVATDLEPARPISADTTSSIARSRPTGAARVVFIGCLLLAGILVVTGLIIALSEISDGDDPSEVAVYVWLPAIFLLSTSLAVLLPNIRVSMFVVGWTVLFVSGGLVVWQTDAPGSPYWALLTTVAAPAGIVGSLVSFAIWKFMRRPNAKADAQSALREKPQ